MIRHLAAALLTACGLSAQKLRVEQNASAPWDATESNPAGFYLVFEVTVASQDPVTAIELPLRPSNPSTTFNGTINLVVFDSQQTNAPAALGQWSTRYHVDGWASVRLNHPVPVSPSGTTIWVGLSGVGRFLDVAASTQGSVVQPRWTISTFGSPASSWTPAPTNGLAVPLRVYCGAHSGIFFTRGGGLGSSRVVGPLIETSGFPNTENTVSFRVRHAHAPSQAALFVGDYRYRAIPPFGLIMNPVFGVLPFMTSTYPSTTTLGYGNVDLAIPNDPSLRDISFGVQAVILDPFEPLGLTVTTGYQMRVGD